VGLIVRNARLDIVRFVKIGLIVRFSVRCLYLAVEVPANRSSFLSLLGFQAIELIESGLDQFGFAFLALEGVKYLLD
jgi:hypothetical protein